MARIPMTSGFTLIPEGEYVFRIYDAIYDEDFGKIEIKLVNAQGATHTVLQLRTKTMSTTRERLMLFHTSQKQH